jgi:polyisoprenoid-binding protein YceI
MLATRPRPGILHALIPLSAGALTFAALWLVGAQQFGWLGFLTAGLAWSALSRNAVYDDTAYIARPPDVPAPAPSPSATAPARENGAPATTHGIAAGRYLIDPERTTVRMHVRKLGFIPVRGLFTRVRGTIDVDEDPTRSRITATVASGSLRTGNPYRDAHVVGPAFLDAQRHPVLRYEGRPSAVDPDGRWTVSGNLTVKGVTLPVTFTPAFVACVNADSLRLTAEAAISRRSFGVAAYGWLAGDEILVRVRAEANRTPGSTSGED